MCVKKANERKIKKVENEDDDDDKEKDKKKPLSSSYQCDQKDIHFLLSCI